MLHPAIRVLCLGAAAAQLPALPLTILLGTSAVLLIAHFSRQLLRDLWRLRWMLLAILILYAAFTPGEPLWPVLPGLSRDGLLEGARRALVIVVLLQMVLWLLAVTALPRLCAGLMLLSRPFALIGLPADAFARRLALALGEVTRAQMAVDQARRSNKTTLFASAAALVLAIERGDGSATPMSIAPLPMPSLWQWLLPPAVWLLLWSVAQ